MINDSSDLRINNAGSRHRFVANLPNNIFWFDLFLKMNARVYEYSKLLQPAQHSLCESEHLSVSCLYPSRVVALLLLV